jgi:hypothetical protein
MFEIIFHPYGCGNDLPENFQCICKQPSKAYFFIQEQEGREFFMGGAAAARGGRVGFFNTPPPPLHMGFITMVNTTCIQFNYVKILIIFMDVILKGQSQ